MNKILEEWVKNFEEDWENPPPDYAGEIDKYCQYPVPLPLMPQYNSDCGDPATHWVWDSVRDISLNVCDYHLERFEEEND